jgi:hypothetical protein
MIFSSAIVIVIILITAMAISSNIVHLTQGDISPMTTLLPRPFQPKPISSIGNDTLIDEDHLGMSDASNKWRIIR